MRLRLRPSKCVPQIYLPNFMTDPNVNPDSPTNATSLSLLERVKHDENQAWESLVDLYAPIIYARCRSYWGLPAHESENIGQDVFASVARKIKEFQRERIGSFRKWIRVITDNKCRDFLRKQKLDFPVGGSEAKRKLEDLPEDIDDSISAEDEATERAILMRQAMKAVENEFSPRDWQLFWDVTVEDRNRQVVAADVGVSDNVVYLALSRIRKRLREVYVDLIDDEFLSPPVAG